MLKPITVVVSSISPRTNPTPGATQGDGARIRRRANRVAGGRVDGELARVGIGKFCRCCNRPADVSTINASLRSVAGWCCRIESHRPIDVDRLPNRHRFREHNRWQKVSLPASYRCWLTDRPTHSTMSPRQKSWCTTVSRRSSIDDAGCRLTIKCHRICVVRTHHRRRRAGRADVVL